MTTPDPWNVTVSEAIAIQKEMRDRLIASPPPDFRPRRIAGADVSMTRFSKMAYAGLVVLDAGTRETLEQATAVSELRFPYVPGLLSFRELPALEPAWSLLTQKPDVVIFDGAGYAHPRRFGLACHGGFLWGVPSIGCAKSILIGTHGPLDLARGSQAELVHDGEVIGMAVRLRDNSAPLYVSIGHLMDLETAVEIVLSMGAGFREPETTRRAHALVNKIRRAELDANE
jgi:deoxyribonuclease V